MIGMVEVAALAANAEGSPPVVARTVTGRRTSSNAIAGSRSYWPSAHRYSIATFWPSTKPFSPRPRRNAATRCAVSSGDLALRYPITGIAVCCARAASGHATAAPRSVMNWRRLVCRERSIVRGDEGRIMTRPSSRPEARSLLGYQTANELGAPVASSIPAQLPGHEPASARMGYEDGHALFLRY